MAQPMRNAGQGRVGGIPGAALVFHGELCGLLSRGCAADGGPVTVVWPAARRASVKDVIESMGPPHTEVGSIEADGRAVDFGHPLEAGQHVHVRPVEAPFDVLVPSPLRPVPLTRTAFLVDDNVARLADLLRALGFDAHRDSSLDDAGLAEAAAREGRILLSRDRGLLKRSRVVFGRMLRACSPAEQLTEVLRHFGLRPPYAVFTRCIRCNTPLVPVPKAEIVDRLLPLTRIHYEEFRRCLGCGKIYWAGSHHEKMEARVRRLCAELEGKQEGEGMDGMDFMD